MASMIDLPNNLNVLYLHNKQEKLSLSRYKMFVHRDRIKIWNVGFNGDRKNQRTRWIKPQSRDEKNKH